MPDEPATIEPPPVTEPVTTTLKDFGNLNDVFDAAFPATKTAAAEQRAEEKPVEPVAPPELAKPAPAPTEPEIDLLPAALFGEPAKPEPQKEIPIPEGLTKPKDIQTWKELRHRLDTAEADAAKYRTEATEYKTKFDTEQPDLLKAKLAETEQRAKEMSERISMVDLRLHPEFQRQFEAPIAREHRNAVELVKNSGADPVELEQALRLPPGIQRTEALDAVVEGIRSPSTQAELGAVLKEISGLERSRAGALADAKGNWDRLQEYDKAQRYEAIKQDQQRNTEMLRDIEKNLVEEHKIAFLRKIDGNDEWNRQVDSESELANRVATQGKDPRELITLLRLGAAAPRMYNTAIALRKKLQEVMAENAAFKSADPDLGGGREIPNGESDQDKKLSFADAVARGSGLR